MKEISTSPSDGKKQKTIFREDHYNQSVLKKLDGRVNSHLLKIDF